MTASDAALSEHAGAAPAASASATCDRRPRSTMRREQESATRECCATVSTIAARSRGVLSIHRPAKNKRIPVSSLWIALRSGGVLLLLPRREAARDCFTTSRPERGTARWSEWRADWSA